MAQHECFTALSWCRCYMPCMHESHHHTCPRCECPRLHLMHTRGRAGSQHTTAMSHFTRMADLFEMALQADREQLQRAPETRAAGAGGPREARTKRPAGRAKRQAPAKEGVRTGQPSSSQRRAEAKQEPSDDDCAEHEAAADRGKQWPKKGSKVEKGPGRPSGVTLASKQQAAAASRHHRRSPSGRRTWKPPPGRRAAKTGRDTFLDQTPPWHRGGGRTAERSYHQGERHRARSEEGCREPREPQKTNADLAPQRDTAVEAEAPPPHPMAEAVGLPSLASTSVGGDLLQRPDRAAESTTSSSETESPCRHRGPVGPAPEQDENLTKHRRYRRGRH